MGNNIKETSVPFNIDRKLTKKEIKEVIKYCTWDVENTAEVFMENIDTFNAFLEIIKAFPDQLSLFNLKDSGAQITANVLGCERTEWDDEFDFFFVPCLELKKYKHVQDWFAQFIGQKFEHESDKKNFYKTTSLTVDVAGVPHTFGFGGCHGAPESPLCAQGGLFHVDVNNYYPSFLLAYLLVTRAAKNDNFKVIYNRRKELKYKQTHAKDKTEAKQYKKAQMPYKLILNSLSGAMKDKGNKAYDPRNNNVMCINGQLMLLDLIEHLEIIPGFRLIQSNTDGLIIQIPDTDEAFDMLDDICYEWETRCSTEHCDILLETDQINKIDTDIADTNDRLIKISNNLYYIKRELDQGNNSKEATYKELKEKETELLNRLQDLIEKKSKCNAFMKTNFALYKRNRSIIEHIRNSIAHGNISLNIFNGDYSINDALITLRDTFDDKNTFTLEITMRQFNELCSEFNIGQIEHFLTKGEESINYHK